LEPPEALEDELDAAELDAGVFPLLELAEEVSPAEVEPPLFTVPALPAALLPA